MIQIVRLDFLSLCDPELNSPTKRISKQPISHQQGHKHRATMAGSDLDALKQEVADDVRVLGYDPLIPPQLLTSEIPAPEKALETVLRGRKEAVRIITQQDDRLLVMVGPW